MRRSLSLLALGLLLTPNLEAQVTVPEGYMSRAGVSFSSWPFGLSGAARLQYLYHKDLVARPVVAVTFLAFRPAPNRAAAAKNGIELEIKMSHSPVDIFAATTSWTGNHGQDVKTTFNKKTVNLPAQMAATPGAFSTEFKLDSPFVYSKARGNFIVDYIVTQVVAGTYSHDGEWTKPATNTPVGQGCQGMTQTVTGTRPTTQTNMSVFTMNNGPAAGVGVHIIGASALPSPVPLPGGGCPLNIAPLFVFTTTINSGTASLTYPTPVGIRTRPDLDIYSQWIAVTGSGWRSSPGAKVSFGGFVNCGRILHTSSATAAAAQRKQIGFGIIHRLR